MDIRVTYSDIGAPGPFVMPPVLWYENLGQHRIELRSGGYCRFDFQTSNTSITTAASTNCAWCSTAPAATATAPGALRWNTARCWWRIPDVPHEIESRDSRDLLVMYLSMRMWSTPLPPSGRYEDALVGGFLRRHRTVAHGQDHLVRLLGVLGMCSGAAHDDAHRQHHALGLVAYGILAALHGDPLPAFIAPTMPESPLARALSFIDTNSHRPVMVDEIARHVDLGERQLRRLFQQGLNKTVVAVITERRLNYAAQHLLMGTEVGVAAAAIGIRSTPQFCRMFKRQFGVSPSAYARHLRSTVDSPRWTEHGVG